MHDDGVQRDRVDDAVGADDLDHERLPRGVVDRQHRRRAPAPARAPSTAARRPSPPGEQRQRRHHQRQLRDGQQRAASDSRSASRPPQAPNSRIGRNCRPAVRPTEHAGAGQLDHQPHLADDLHPVAGDRDHLAAEVLAVVRDLERGERARERRRSLGALLEHPLEDAGGAVQRGEVLGAQPVQPLEPDRRPCARATAASSASPGGASRRPGSSGGRRDRRCARSAPPPPAARARAWRSGAGCFSRAASSDGVSGPWQSIVLSAAPWVGLRSPPACLAHAPREPGDHRAQAMGEIGGGDGLHR